MITLVPSVLLVLAFIGLCACLGGLWYMCYLTSPKRERAQAERNRDLFPQSMKPFDHTGDGLGQ